MSLLSSWKECIERELNPAHDAFLRCRVQFSLDAFWSRLSNLLRRLKRVTFTIYISTNSTDSENSSTVAVNSRSQHVPGTSVSGFTAWGACANVKTKIPQNVKNEKIKLRRWFSKMRANSAMNIILKWENVVFRHHRWCSLLCPSFKGLVAIRPEKTCLCCPKDEIWVNPILLS